jgi:hypothetical protein
MKLRKEVQVVETNLGLIAVSSVNGPSRKIINHKLRKGCFAQYQWFMPVVLVTWEAEIGRIMVQVQLGQIVCKTSIPI